MSEFKERGAAVPDPNDFDAEKTDLDPRVELRLSFSETLTRHGFSDTLVLARERAGVVFHDRRLEIIDYLDTHEPRSVRALAEELGYDKGVVSRDLQKLASIDVVEYEKAGRAKAPRLAHEHIVIEPVI